MSAGCAGAPAVRERVAAPAAPASHPPSDPAPQASAEQVDASPAAEPQWCDPAVLATLEQYYEAFATGDWQHFGALFWPGATIVTLRYGEPSGEGVVATGIERYVARAQHRTQALELERDETRVEIVGAAAQAIVRYRASDRSGDAPQRWRGVDAFTLVQHGERWLIASVVVADGLK